MQEKERATARKGRPFNRGLVEGPIRKAVWTLAWPTMLQNLIGGLQGVVDHAMVGHYVGYTGNAAIGVSWQIFLVVVVFISSLFAGMGVLVARFAGANDPEKVNRVVYQAFMTAAGLSICIMAPVGYFLAPSLLDLVNAAPEVQAEALPYLRIMFLFSFGMMTFFMAGGAFRSAGDDAQGVGRTRALPQRSGRRAPGGEKRIPGVSGCPRREAGTTRLGRSTSRHRGGIDDSRAHSQPSISS